MTYGAVMYGPDGQKIFDPDLPVLMVAEKGTLMDYLDVFDPPDDGGATIYTNEPFVGYWSVRARDPYIEEGTTLYTVNMPMDYKTIYDQNTVPMPVFPTVYQNSAGMLFVQTQGLHGILAFIEVHFDYSNYSKGCLPFVALDSLTATTVPYMFVANTFDGPVDGVSQYGLKTWDAAGALTYDSQRQAPPIEVTALIDTAAFDDILDNDATRVITLPTAMPNCWIAAPSFSAFKVFTEGPSGGYYYHNIQRVMIKQTSDTEITLSRFHYRSPRRTFSPSPATARYVRNDQMIFISRNITG